MADIRPTEGKSTLTRPYINWLVMNLRATSDSSPVDLSSALTLRGYESPKPSTDDAHTFVVFLYEQEEGMHDTDDINLEMAKYSDDNCLR